MRFWMAGIIGFDNQKVKLIVYINPIAKMLRRNKINGLSRSDDACPAA
jgi:hypothetical protein